MKMRKGPFKGKQWSEVDIADLLAYMRTEEASDPDNGDFTLQVLEEIDRRRGK
jgi:hypothetical protein